jgi:hypothetical protein
MIGRLPFWAAMCSGVSPSDVLAFTLAPRSIRKAAIDSSS